MPATAFIARRQWVAAEGLRLDSGAYAGGALAVRDRITDGRYSWEPLSAISTIFRGPLHQRRYVRDPRHGTPYLTGSDAALVDLPDDVLLSNTLTPELPVLRIKVGWTLVTSAGTIGNTTYVRDDMTRFVVSQDMMRVVPIDDVAPGYLFAFLSTEPARAMMRARTYGSVVQRIEPHHLADIPVPLPDPAVQQRIHDLVAGAAAARTEASRLLDKAGAYFDGLAGPLLCLHEHARAMDTVDRSSLNGRLDAFNHVGWAVEPGDIDGTPIGNIARVTRPGIVKRTFVERGVPFVSGIDVYQARPQFRQRIMLQAAERAESIINRHQLLVQRGGQRYGLLGRPALVTARMDGWAASEDLIRIALKNVEKAGWVFAYLRCETGRRRLMRHSFGTSIPKLNETGVEALSVPPLPRELQDGASRALALREQADADEEQAIREVESWLT